MPYYPGLGRVLESFQGALAGAEHEARIRYEAWAEKNKGKR